MAQLRVLMAGGGTGGHVFPLVAVARALKKISFDRGIDLKIFFVGPEEFPLQALREEGLEIKTIIQAGKLRRYFSLKYLADILKIPLAFLSAFVRIWRIRPDVVLGKGGYGSVIPVLAAWLLGSPVLLHESDVKPGLANGFLAWSISPPVAVSFKETGAYFKKSKVFLTGNPVRLEFKGIKKSEAQNVLKFQPRRKVIFISGGSQGALSVSNLVLKIINQITRNYALIWSTGEENFRQVVKKLKVKVSPNIKIFPLLSEPELAAAYTLADLVVMRAGSGSIFEAAAFGKAGVIMPLSGSAGDHQRLNAQVYALGGAAVVLDECRLSAAALFKTVDSLMSSPQKRRDMAGRAQQFAKVEAADDIAQILMDLARK